MKKILLLIVILGGMTSYVSGQLRLSKEDIESMRESMEAMCKIMFSAEYEEAGISPDCACGVNANVAVKLMTQKYEGKTFDLADVMEFYSEIYDPNSTLHNEFVSTLQTELQKQCIGALPQATVSGPASGFVPLLRYGTMYKIKVRLGTSEKYYMMDSGASVSLISQSYANELTAAGLITPDQHAGEFLLELADGTTNTCQMVLLNKVKIGSFTLDDVAFGIIEEDIAFLLGKNILDAFHSWNINNNNSTLQLVK
jgi:hypothetical protein